MRSHEEIAEALEREAHVAEMGLAFMSDDLVAETEADIALRREAAEALRTMPGLLADADASQRCGCTVHGLKGDEARCRHPRGHPGPCRFEGERYDRDRPDA